MRTWLLPLGALTAASALVFFVTPALRGAAELDELVAALLHPDAEAAAAVLAGAGEIIAAVLGIAITVVAIVVELAANRYTHRVADLFTRAPVNLLVTGFMVVAAVQCLLVSLTSAVLPPEEVLLSVGLLILSLLLLLPYFAYVFTFLNPLNIVSRLRREAMTTVARRRPTTESKVAAALSGVDQIAEMGQNALANRDKGVAVACIEALGEMAIQYQDLRAGLPEEWYVVDGDLAHDLDFVSLSPEILGNISRRRIWFEMKVLRRYEALFSQALKLAPDLNHLVAIRTRMLAEDARQREVVALGVKFFNTYLRASLNARDVRTAYNVLQQYRLLAERALDYDDGALAVEIGEHLLYYARQAFPAKLPFMVETIGYDFSALIEVAYDKRSLATPELLKGFLRLDEEARRGESGDGVLQGVRKAQVRLATFFLVRGAEKPARRIWEDMRYEPAARLRAIRDDLLRVSEREFWEINDRGVNFEFLPEERRVEAERFFGWFDQLASEPPPEKKSTTSLIERTLVPTPIRDLGIELD